MAQIYKVLADFELDGVAVRKGEEIACRAREAEKLILEKKLAVSDRELDLNEPKDIALKAAADSRASKRHSELKDTEESRETAKDEREAENDTLRGEKVEKAKELAQRKLGEVPEYMHGLTGEELDKEIEKLEGAEDFKAPEPSTEASEEKPAPKRTRTAR